MRFTSAPSERKPDSLGPDAFARSAVSAEWRRGVPDGIAAALFRADRAGRSHLHFEYGRARPDTGWTGATAEGDSSSATPARSAGAIRPERNARCARRTA